MKPEDFFDVILLFMTLFVVMGLVIAFAKLIFWFL